MADALIFLLVIVNLLISGYNAWVVGKSWADVQAIGSGWQKIVVASAFIMSGCGFTWCYLAIFAFIAIGMNLIDVSTVQAMLDLGYLAIIVPVLGSGLALWIDSVTTAYRRRDISSVGTAAWNTFAQAHNTYRAITDIGSVLERLGKFAGSGRGKGKGQLLVILLVIFALMLGFLTTFVITMMSAGAYSRNVLAEISTHPTAPGQASQ